jgi:hypothetical protein
MSIEVTGYDNRGSQDVPFGYVYFADGTRVCYAQGDVWEGNWGSVANEHFIAAAAFLAERGIVVTHALT